MKKQTLLTLLLLNTLIGFAQLPAPPTGFRWVIQPEFSDEFNGTELDLDKWYNYHPTWNGRAPAMFHTDMVSVKDGMLQIKNEKLEKDSLIPNWNNTAYTTYSIAGGAVVSRKASAYFGYYECKMKANKTLMSSTFWMSNNGADGHEDCNDRYSLELDIQECVGRESSASKTFHKGMHSNTHYWYNDCDGAKKDGVVGAQFDDTKACSDDFNVYAAHWIDEEQVRYHYNNEESKLVNFSKAYNSKPFDRPMWINMVTETYTWIGNPNDEELADPTKNVTYYDWIRSYKLIPIGEVLEEEDPFPNAGFESGTSEHWGGWGGNPREVVAENQNSGDYAYHIKGAGAPERVIALKPNTEYKITCYVKVVSGAVTLGVKGNDNTRIAAIEIPQNDEYAKVELPFISEKGGSFKMFLYAPNSDDEAYLDDVEFIEVNKVEKPQEISKIFDEGITIIDHQKLFVDASTLSTVLEYKLNTSGFIKAEIKDSNDQVVATKQVNLLAGFGKFSQDFAFDFTPDDNTIYTVSLKTYSSENTSEAIATQEIKVSKEVQILGINDVKTSIKVYPNPSADIIYVESASFDEDYELFNLAGQVVKRGRLNAQKSIALSGLPPHTYFLVLGGKESIKVIKNSYK